VSTTDSPIRPGSRRFVAALSMCMAVTALGVDTVLPAYDSIRTSLGLADGATEITGLITFYLMGNALGLLPAGLLADRYGRRPVMWGGLALYVVGAVGSVLAPSLGVMLVARFVWGLGGAGPRVATLAMVRDEFSGERMARQMSLIMAVFLIVPAIGPSLAAGLLLVGPWQTVFWMCAVAGVVVAVVIGGLPETLPAVDRRPLAVGSVGRSLWTVVTTPGTCASLVSLTALFGAFLAYLAGFELIVDQTYGMRPWFPLVFGVLALAMLGGMLLNGRLVERLGLERLLGLTFAANLTAVGSLAAVVVATGGRPPFVVLVVAIGIVLFFQQMLIPNLNAAAMRPLGAVAGTGAALLGMIPGTLGAVLGEVVNRRFDGTARPLAVGFVASSTVAWLAWRSARRRSPASVDGR
jgi:DHA1 family bicyclomycin/chloramphenicol resistance-like MFS transporter